MPQKDVVGAWKRFIITSSDETFFAIVRTHLGPIKTPFNKHVLVDRLTAFLTKKETVRRILDLVDETDARILTAVDMISGASAERLCVFFQHDMSLLDLHHHLLNLEERLLVVRFTEEGRAALCLNPLLREALKREVVNPGLIFPSVPADEQRVRSFPAPWISDSVLAAFLSYVFGAPELLRSDGSCRKKTVADMELLFPALSLNAGGAVKLLRLVEVLTRLGLLTTERGRVDPVIEAWRTFSLLSPDERKAYIIAYGSGKEETAAASTVLAFLRALPEGRAYTREVLERFLGAGDERFQDAGRGAKVIDSCIEFGVIIRTDSGRCYLNPQALAAEPPQNGGSREVRLVFQPTMELTLSPLSLLGECLPVAVASDLRKHDVVAHFEVTKSSFCRALDNGYSRQLLLASFEALSESALPHNAQFLFQSWEAEFRGLRVIRGTILIVDEDRRHLIEHSDSISPLIAEVLAPGIYMMKTEDHESIAKALAQAGIEQVPSASDPARAQESSHEQASTLGALSPDTSFPAALCGFDTETGSARRSPKPAGADVQEELERHLDSMGLPVKEWEERRKRIERKLVLFTSQLEWESQPGETTEVKGFDYVGKVRLIEQALRSGDNLMEVLVKDRDGSPTRMLVKPVELQRNGSELVLKCSTLPAGKRTSITVRKIGHLRKLKGSLYASDSG